MHVSPHAFPVVHTLQHVGDGGVGLGLGVESFRIEISALTAPFTLTVRSVN
jgi:hypothetical protein